MTPPAEHPSSSQAAPVDGAVGFAALPADLRYEESGVYYRLVWPAEVPAVAVDQRRAAT